MICCDAIGIWIYRDSKPINNIHKLLLIMKKIILFVLALLLGLLFVNAGMDKFFHYMPMPEQMPEEIVKDFQAMMEIAWLMP